MKYLAYGSNMDEGIMMGRCPKAKLIGTGILKDWRLMFKGYETFVTTYATIEQWQGYQVPYLLWEITEEDEKSLDRYEGVSKFCYYKKYVEVEVGGEKYTALVYVKDETEPVNVACDHYTAVLWDAYVKFGFDLEILKAACNFSDERLQRRRAMERHEK